MSSILLEAIVNCKNTQELTNVLDLAKDTKTTTKSIKKAIHDSKAKGFKIGKGVMLKHDPSNEIGKVVNFNTSTVGFYTGDYYPIIVKFERGTFEYGLNSLTII